jgi:hypothetical protein
MAFNQPATFNEEWPDQRVFSFLNHMPPDGVDADFHVLYDAYKHMRPFDYERLLVKFKALGRNVNAVDNQGRTLAQVIAAHPSQNSQFLELLAKFA